MAKKDFEARINSLKDYMLRQKLDTVFITNPTNVYYFSGFSSDPHERFMALVIDSKKDQTLLFVPSLDAEKAEKESNVQRIIPISDIDDPYLIFRDQLGPEVNSMGIQKKEMSLYQFEKLSETYLNIKLVDIELFIMSLRMKKSAEEMELVKAAVKAVEKVLELGIQKVKQGMSELELTAELEYQMRVLGTDGPAFQTIVLSGNRSALPHGCPGTRRFEPNDFLLIDMGVLWNGYRSDITRTFIIGEGTAKQNKIYETVVEANRRAIEAVVPGVTLASIDHAARQFIQESGFGSLFNHRIGHGLGLDIHETPSIHENNVMPIEKGLLFTIEPGIYDPVIGGVRIEDDIYIDENGQVQVLTSFPKELIRL